MASRGGSGESVCHERQWTGLRQHLATSTSIADPIPSQPVWCRGPLPKVMSCKFILNRMYAD